MTPNLTVLNLTVPNLTVPNLTVPVLAGPTASGKSDLALRLAQNAPVEVVSADAMMVYRGMDIGTAKPTLAERRGVPHHLIDIVDPNEPFSVADYVKHAETVIADVLERGKLPLIVGGTGFYIRALSEGLPTVPPADAEVQAELWKRLEREGLERLVDELQTLSPEDAARAQRNPRRVVRALEIFRRTGRAPSNFANTTPRFRYDKAILLPDAQALGERIALRTERMFRAGLAEEVRDLLDCYPARPTATQAIGYKEVTTYLEGRCTLREAEQAVTLATTRYAKRQRTWFRKEPGAKLYPFEDEVEFGAVAQELRGWLESQTGHLGR